MGGAAASGGGLWFGAGVGLEAEGGGVDVLEDVGVVLEENIDAGLAAFAGFPFIDADGEAGIEGGGDEPGPGDAPGAQVGFGGGAVLAEGDDEHLVAGGLEGLREKGKELRVAADGVVDVEGDDHVWAPGWTGV